MHGPETGIIPLRDEIACGNPTLAASSYWNLVCDCARCVVAVRLLLLSDEPVAHSEGGKSSRTSGWIICAMTGWACLSCMIFVISRINASGSSTNAWASASGLSSTMAMSISPRIFLDEGRSAFLHSVQDCHSFVFTYAPFPFFDGPLC